MEEGVVARRRLLLQEEVVRADTERESDLLCVACAGGDLCVVRTVYDDAAEAVALDPDLLGAALRAAALMGHEDVLSFLLARGATADLTDPHSGVTALMLGACRGHAGVVALLLRRGADPRLRNQLGHTVLDVALSRGRGHVVSLLQLHSGLSPAVRTLDSLSPAVRSPAVRTLDSLSPGAAVLVNPAVLLSPEPRSAAWKRLRREDSDRDDPKRPRLSFREKTDLLDGLTPERPQPQPRLRPFWRSLSNRLQVLGKRRRTGCAKLVKVDAAPRHRSKSVEEEEEEEEVSHVLRANRLAQYVPLFREHEVDDVACLSRLTDEDLWEMGVLDREHRLVLLHVAAAAALYSRQPGVQM